VSRPNTVSGENIKARTKYNIGASLHCAASHPCPDIYFKNVNITANNQTLGLPFYNTTLQFEVIQVCEVMFDVRICG
jgi:galacturan 1,4-alpha-galacturonidase